MRCSLQKRALVKQAALLLLTCVSWLSVAGQSGPAQRIERAQLVSFGLDPQDYNETAQVLSSSIFVEKRLGNLSDKVLVIGPVDTEDCYFPIDDVLLQERIQTAIQRSGLLQVHFAANVLPEKSAQQALQNIMEFNYHVGDESLAAAEDLQHLASLSEIDFLLFGRVSSLIRYHRDYKEVTFVFNWKIGNARTGLIEWTDEIEFTKSGPIPDLPQWFVAPPQDSSRNVYAVGHAVRSSEQEAIQAAIAAATLSIKTKLDSEYAETSWIEDFGSVLNPDQVVPILTRNQTERRQRHAWVLAKLDQRHIASHRAARAAALDFFAAFDKDLAAAHHAFAANDLVNAAQIVRMLENRLAQLPAQPEGILMREHLHSFLGEFELAAGNPGSARRHWEDIARLTASTQWRERAEAQLRQISVNEEQKIVERLRSMFGGQKVLLLAAYRREDGKIHSWIDRETALRELVVKGWGEPIEDRSALSSWLSAENQGAAGSALARERGANSVFFLAADGTIESRLNDKAPTGEDTRFFGNLSVGFISENQAPRLFEVRASTRWQLHGPDMAIDEYGIVGLREWEKQFLQPD